MIDHAVVLGAGIAGLLAAAALAESSSTVTVVERDRLPDGPVERRGVPHALHLHSLLSRGWLTIDELLPGFLADLISSGVRVLDGPHLGAHIHVQNGPYTFNRTDPLADPAALAMYLASRPLMEHHLRRRVAALPNVRIVDNHDVVALVAAQPNRITGVSIGDRRTGQTRTLTGQVIVDATGRGTRTPLLLDKLGFGRPPQQSFTVHGVYYSQRIAIPDEGSFPERVILVVPPTGGGRGGLVAGEDATWTLTIAKRANDPHVPPTTFADMVSEAEAFVPPHIHPALRRAQPLSDVMVHRYPGGTWHRYDRHAHHPDGLFVVGDALCCLDPIHGQGVTLAAMHARILRILLRDGEGVAPQRFHQSVAKVIAPIWAMNQPPTHRTARGFRQVLQGRAIRWGSIKVLEAADDIVVTERLIRVVNLIDPPQRLMHPSVLTRVAAHHLRRRLTTRRRRRHPPQAPHP